MIKRIHIIYILIYIIYSFLLLISFFKFVVFLQVKKSSIIMDSFLYIYKLILKLEEIKREYSNLMAIKKEYLNLMKHIQVPKVSIISASLFLSVASVYFSKVFNFFLQYETPRRWKWIRLGKSF